MNLYQIPFSVGINGRDIFYNEVAKNPGFDVCRDSMDFLVNQIQEIEVKLEDFKKLGMPIQYIHADLHFDNVMVLGDKVSGLLDFEFCTYDWRGMEMAGGGYGTEI